MKVLIVGSGGREHALSWKLKQSQLVDELYIAPGNGGTAAEGVNVSIKADDLPGLVRFAKEKAINLVVAGPELPLVLGLADALKHEGIRCFGPSAFAANLEGSKAFAKTTMRDAGVPTAPFQIFDEFERAKTFVEHRGTPIVIKADGLAAGKGVVVAKTVEEAVYALNAMMVQGIFGAAGKRVVVEECLAGEEASFLAFCDGLHYALLPSAQDHKAVGEGDTGPNTGGMGAYSPAPVLPQGQYQAMAALVIEPILKYLAAKGCPFVGMLYAGLMFTPDGPSVLEYNVRFGDPECQPLVLRLNTDLAEIMLACVDGTLDRVQVECTPKTALGVVLASGGYPGAYEKGKVISGIEQAETDPDVKVFVAGAQRDGDRLLTSGGRVLCVTALGDGLAEARDRAYRAVDKISFENSYHRRDIGDKGLKRLGE